MARQAPLIAAEKETLHAFLEVQRDVMVWKLEGLGDDDQRRPMTPSGTSLLGMVKHLAAVEYGWFCKTFGREIEPMPFDEDDEDADFRVDPTETSDDIMAFYARARSAADHVIADLDLDATGTAWWDAPVSLRWVLVHMIEETARHAGHADILRELIDNTTGYRAPGYLPDD